MRKEYEEAAQHLESIGFAKTGPSEFTHTSRGNRKAVVWPSGMVTVTEYTPNTNRYLSSYSVKNAKEIKQ